MNSGVAKSRKLIENSAYDINILESHLEISSEELKAPLKFHYFWLRDHCRCIECYNYRTHQITSNILKIPFDIAPTQCSEKGNNITITWKDGHETEFSLPWLKNLEHTRKSSLNEKVYWNKHTVSSLKGTQVTYEEYMGHEGGLKNLLQSILKYGFGFVTGVEPTLEATAKVVQHMAQIKRTIFGEMWKLTNDLFHDDTAYTTMALGAHNDNTYWNEAAGLQVFHMLNHEGTGGETLLVDGFNTANNLRKSDGDSFKTLCNSPVEAEYIEKGIHYATTEPVIKLHPISNDFLQIRYNIYDRATLNTLEFDEIMKFYKAYRLLGEEINEPNNQWWMKLTPGSVIFIDNWRILHGRASYTGKRRLTGCYVGRSDWLSVAKHLGLSTY